MPPERTVNNFCQLQVSFQKELTFLTFGGPRKVRNSLQILALPENKMALGAPGRSAPKSTAATNPNRWVEGYECQGGTLDGTSLSEAGADPHGDPTR